MLKVRRFWTHPLRMALASAFFGLVAITLVGMVIAQTPISGWHIWFSFLSGAVNGVIAVIVYRHSEKEEKPSSPSQQPTSGTFPNPSLSQYLTGGIVNLSQTVSSGANPSQPSLSPKQFPSEARLMPVVGFRSWHARPFHRVGIGGAHWLGSYNERYGIWKPGKNQAGCYAPDYAFSLYSRPAPHGPTPKADCSCGFYVLTDFDAVPFVTTSPMMVGAVVGWGRVVQHGDEGWRAEFTQVIALLDCKVSDEHLAMTREIAALYGVPVVGRTALELMAKEYGDPLPQLGASNTD